MKYFILVFTLIISIECLADTPNSKWEVTEAERSCLYLNAYFEGANDTVSAQQGFIETVLNRRISDKYPNDACSVIFDSNAFSWTREDYMVFENQKHIFKLIKILVDGILAGLKSGNLHEITYGAMFYHARYIDPCWIPDMKLTNKLGSHLFYVQVRKTGACLKSNR